MLTSTTCLRIANTGYSNANMTLPSPLWRTGEESRGCTPPGGEEEYSKSQENKAGNVGLVSKTLPSRPFRDPGDRTSPIFTLVSSWTPFQTMLTIHSYLFAILPFPRQNTSVAYPVGQGLCVYSNRAFTAETGYTTNTVSHLTCSFYIYIWSGTPEISVKAHTTPILFLHCAQFQR